MAETGKGDDRIFAVNGFAVLSPLNQSRLVSSSLLPPPPPLSLYRLGHYHYYHLVLDIIIWLSGGAGVLPSIIAQHPYAAFVMKMMPSPLCFFSHSCEEQVLTPE